MSRPVTAAGHGTEFHAAFDLMRHHKVHHPPLVEAGRAVGIVAARMLVEKRIGSLPVLNARKQLVGIIIETDVFKVMAGMARPRQAKKFRRHR